MSFNPDAVSHWLERVYGQSPGLLSVAHQDKNGKFRAAGGTIDTLKAAAQLVTRLDQANARSIYLRTTTLSARPSVGERGGVADALALPAFWADVDFGDVGHSHDPAKHDGRGLPPDAAEAKRIVTESGLPAPSLWVHSGGGLYPWWLLDQPLILDDDNRHGIAAMSASWQQALQRSAHRLGYSYGAGVGDLARVLRIPGTVNRKDGKARPCHVVQDDGTAYTLADLTSALQKATPAPAPAAPLPRSAFDTTPRTGASAFDLLDQHATFDDILTGANWTRCTTGHASNIEACWTRPGNPEHTCSAHTLTAMPQALVVFSESAGLPVGAGQKLTRGRLFAHLWHQGDERASALDLYAAIGGRPSTPAAAALPLPREARPVNTPSTIGRGDLVETAPAADPTPAGDIETFWDQREVLAHIRDFARARMTSPWAVLGVVLARVLTTAPPYVVLPPTIGTEASLNLFVALVGASGMGKGAAEGAARDALDVGEDVFTATVGSGEGVAHLYSHWTVKTGVVRDRSAVLFTIPEVDILTALGSRVGSTILSVLRSAFSGEKLGFSNASKERTLPLDRHTYRLCLILGVQPERASALMDDADGGTPQRFLWMPVGDPGIPDITPDPPPTMNLPAQQWNRGNFPLHRLNLPDIATETIRQAQRARHRGEGDALDGHALQVRTKVAVALTLLDGRQTITDDDWHLSGTAMAISDTTRARVLARLAEQANARTEAQGRADGVRADVASQSSDERAARRISARLLAKVVAAGEITRSDARKAIARRDRIHFDAALERLIAAGQVKVLDTEHGQRIVAIGVPS